MSEFPRSDIQQIAAEAASHDWFHSIDLGNGVITQGTKSLEIMQIEFENTFAKIDLRGKTVLDIGAWNGGFSLEAHRRGAASVTALDHHTWRHERRRGRASFDFMARVTGVDFRTIELDLDANPLDMSSVPPHDIVLFLGVFYHLRDPIAPLRQIAGIAREVLVLETYIQQMPEHRPAMVFYPGAELAGDASNWWGPNSACIHELLRMAGFARIEETPGAGRNRQVYHAYRA
ncbi:MAG: class I SAM-dependent methyltransferase [Alphaproteobacteria bacterium]